MAETMAVAKFLNELYVKKHSCAMDQMKKLIYLRKRKKQESYF